MASAIASSMKMARAESDPQLNQQLQEFCKLNKIKVCWSVKAKTIARAEKTKVNTIKYFFELEDDSQNFWSDLFSAPKDVDAYVTDFYATKTVQMMRRILGPDLFLEMKLPPQVNTTNPGVTSVIIENDEVEIKLAENFIQTGSVNPKFATNVNDGDVFLALIKENGGEDAVFCILNINVIQEIDFLEVLLPIYINLLARKPISSNSRTISGSKCWEFFSGLLSAITYPDDMKIPAPGLHLLIDAGLLTENTTHKKCIGLASDNQSLPFWFNRPGAERTNEYDSIMDPTELKSAMAVGGGGFQITLDPQRSLEELTSANESTRITAAASSSSSAAGGEEATVTAVENTGCVGGGSQSKIIVKRGTVAELSQLIENNPEVQQRLSQVVEEEIHRSRTQDLDFLIKSHGLNGKLIKMYKSLSQHVASQTPDASSIQEGISAYKSSSKDWDPEELEADNMAKQAAVEAKYQQRWREAKESDRQRKMEEEEDDRVIKSKIYFHELPYHQGADDPDQGQGQPNWGDGGRRPRRQRRKTKRNNKQTKRMKQKTNKRVNKKQTKRIKKRRTKKV